MSHTRALTICFITATVIIAAFFAWQYVSNQTIENGISNTFNNTFLTETLNEPVEMVDPLIEAISIENLKQGTYENDTLQVVETLTPGSNYARFIASYQVDDITEYGLLTIPRGEPPVGGWPAIIFNHGYISPDVYQTTERYVAYLNGFAQNGYVVFKPDYRGHANSEGEARGGYTNSDYIVDVLHAFHAVQNLPEVNPDKMGMWGHSMGGWITHRVMVIEPDVKVGVIWAGVVGSYSDLLELWRPSWERNNLPSPTPDPNRENRRRWRTYLLEEYGPPHENPELWAEISAMSYLADLSGPVQLHHATGDQSVPHQLSQRYADNLEQENKAVELFIYQGDDHNLSANFGTAMQRSVSIFDRALKE